MAQTETIDEQRHWSNFIIDEVPMNYCRKAVVVAPEQAIEAGSVLGLRTAGVTSVDPPTFEGDGGGAMTLASPAYGAGVVGGDYTVECTTASAGGGTFTIKLPDGTTEDTVAVGTPYDGTIKFTIADGTPDFSQGDTFTVHVAHVTGADGEVVAYDPSATDGGETVTGIAIYDAVTDVDETVDIAALVHGPATVNAAMLVWFEGATDEQIAAGVAALDAIGIRAR